MTKVNYCINCGCEQSLIDVSQFYCERCEAKNFSDSSCELPDPYTSMKQQDFYDNGEHFRDRGSYERYHRDKF